jgi:hypothetical protein
MVLGTVPMTTTAKDALESVSDEKLRSLTKTLLRSLDPILLKAARRGSTSATFTDEQLVHTLSSTANEIAHK